MCNQIQSVLDNEFVSLLGLETDDLLDQIQNTNTKKIRFKLVLKNEML